MGTNLFLIEVLIVAVVIVGIAALFMTRRADRSMAKPLAEPVKALPPVLLPEAKNVRPQDLDALRFSTGLRGYRADQVDEVLDRLMETLEFREKQIFELGGSLESDEKGPDVASETTTMDTQSMSSTP